MNYIQWDRVWESLLSQLTSYRVDLCLVAFIWTVRYVRSTFNRVKYAGRSLLPNHHPFYTYSSKCIIVHKSGKVFQLISKYTHTMCPNIPQMRSMISAQLPETALHLSAPLCIFPLSLSHSYIGLITLSQSVFVLQLSPCEIAHPRAATTQMIAIINSKAPRNSECGRAHCSTSLGVLCDISDTYKVLLPSPPPAALSTTSFSTLYF